MSDAAANLSAYIPAKEWARYRPVVEEFGNTSAAVRKLLHLAALAGGIEELEQLLFEKLARVSDSPAE